MILNTPACDHDFDEDEHAEDQNNWFIMIMMRMKNAEDQNK